MKAIALYNLYIRRVAAAVAIAFAVSVFLYGAFLLMAVAHAAELRGIEDELGRIESSVSTLQAEYIVRTRTLTLDRAYELGFVEPIAQNTVVAGSPGLTLAPAR